MRTLTLLTAIVSLSLAILGNAGEPDFNNWTTESSKQIFIPPARITRVHGKINTVTFPYPPQTGGYPTEVHAMELFDLIFLFLFGPNLTHKYDIEFGDTPGVISCKNPETGYVVTRDRDPNAKWRYHFTVTKNDTIILTAELIPSEDLGPKLILRIKR